MIKRDNQLKLLSPVRSGPITFSNRIIMAPLTRSRADNPALAPTELHAEHYRQRASAGLIISEGTNVSPKAAGYIHVPGLWSKEQIAGWQLVTERVHAEAGCIFTQLWHVGRISHPDFHDGALPHAPSALNPGRPIRTVQSGRTKTVTPHAMSLSEIQATVDDFKRAGDHAMEAAFDGVEIHSSNGYLFHQFFSTSSNIREDRYGGYIENRTRLLFEVIEALKQVMPEERIGLRLNPMMHDDGNIEVNADTLPTFDHIVERLNDYQLSYLHLTRPMRPFKNAYTIHDVIGHYRQIYRGLLVANGNYQPEEAEQELQSGRADAIAFGRPFISNPDLVNRIKNHWPLAEPDNSTFYTQGAEGYTDYPEYDPDN
ncbi:MAG: alkene reductase [Candidatus Marinimicrobia bacterium]|nr:alkene reductase [Candidatus Neomarinimicrobiota bacterium]